jgi:F-type H+-transporting ATPase subunit a
MVIILNPKNRGLLLNFGITKVSLRKISGQLMSFNRILSVFIILTAIFGLSFSAFAKSEEAPKKEEKGINISQVIFGHVADAHEWHLFSITHEGAEPTAVAIPLPVIIYHPEKGFSVFSSSKIEEGQSYEGYHLQRGDMKEKIVSEDGVAIKDFSLTKNVVSMFLSIVILLWLMLAAAKKYKKLGHMTAPNGMQNALEAIIIFVRDEVAKPYLGHKTNRYLPLLLTVFFFIWINNLLGLLPGGANFTGNIAVTGCLALISFIIILASSNKHFWSHLLNPPDVPFGVKLLLVPIEIVSLFIKPAALMIRLFANMLAGHIVILSLVCMIFIFGMLNKVAGIGFIPVSFAFNIVMFMLELLVGAIQAFIFANLTAVFIGQALEGEHPPVEQDYHISKDELIA